MADIEFVIKISEEVKNRLCFGVTYPKDIQAVCEALNNGTPLPKGHGRLIDADEAIRRLCGKSCGCTLEECGYEVPCFSVQRINSAPTIIEAESNEEENVSLQT